MSHTIGHTCVPIAVHGQEFLLSIGLFLYEGVVYRVVDAGAELVLCVWSCICGTGSVEFSC